MRHYRTTLRIILPIKIEAESPDEAQRIIDGVIENHDVVAVIEGGNAWDGFDDCLSGRAERLERDDIEVVDE